MTIAKFIRTIALAGMAVFAMLPATQPLVAADIDGKWAFSWVTPNGSRESVIEIVSQGEKLSAKMGEVELSGTAAEDGFTLAGDYYAAEAGYSGKLSIRGKQEGDKLSGRGSWDAEHTLSFTAVRTD